MPAPSLRAWCDKAELRWLFARRHLNRQCWRMAREAIRRASLMS